MQQEHCKAVEDKILDLKTNREQIAVTKYTMLYAQREATFLKGTGSDDANPVATMSLLLTKMVAFQPRQASCGSSAKRWLKQWMRSCSC